MSAVHEGMHFKRGTKSGALTAVTVAAVVVLGGFALHGNAPASLVPNVDQYSDGTEESQTHDFVHIPYEKPGPETSEGAGQVPEESPEPESNISYGDPSHSEDYYGDYSDYDYDYSDSGDYYGYYGNGVLTASSGVNYYGGHVETYYSQRVLPGDGLNIPGRHVADDGTIRDGNGYIVVASDDLGYGSIVETSLGTGRVYDSFGGYNAGTGNVDIYTDW